MPRPADTYTHSQFEIIASDNQGETVQCKHCRNWTGSIKVLNRKKDHLMKCPVYAQWRASGQGQDLPPPNKYNKRDSSQSWREWDGGDSGLQTILEGAGMLIPSASSLHDSPYGADPGNGAPALARNRNLDIGKYFDEFWDNDTHQKCVRARCLSCGFVRAKNTTRQLEHLTSCQQFLDSPEGQAALARGELEMMPPPQPMVHSADVFAGRAPNPALRMHPLGSTQPQPRPSRPNAMPPPPPKASPSLVSHLLNKWPKKINVATQQQFLSHAGCGTLSASALSHWMGQNAHLTRAMVSFVGSLIGKVRLPETSFSQTHTLYRTMDLLISAVSNLRKELNFLEETRRKYNLEPGNEPITPIIKAYIDLLGSVSDARASLLEGLVVLWATEHFYCVSWQYASNFTHTMPSSNYSIPSYLSSSHNPWSSYTAETPTNNNETQINALRDALIPNWSSRDFVKFVDACKAIVDELANAQTTGSGKEELSNCETQFAQVLFLWERIWPEVDGMGEENGLGDDSVRDLDPRPGGVTGHPGPVRHPEMVSKASAQVVEMEDDGAGEDNGDDGGAGDEDAAMDPADSPYGGTGLGAVAAANIS